jgi:hypothetical protein
VDLELAPVTVDEVVEGVPVSSLGTGHDVAVHRGFLPTSVSPDMG